MGVPSSLRDLQRQEVGIQEEQVQIQEEFVLDILAHTYNPRTQES